MGRPTSRRPRPRPGGRYRIIKSPSEPHCAGRTLTVDAYHGCSDLPAPYVRVTGRVDGLMGSVCFEEGVALERVEP